MKNKESNEKKQLERPLAVNKQKIEPTIKRVEKPKDIIIIKKCNDLIEYDNQGNKIQKPQFKKINITKLVNETKKLVKRDLALEKLDELKKVMEIN